MLSIRLNANDNRQRNNGIKHEVYEPGDRRESSLHPEQKTSIHVSPVTTKAFFGYKLHLLTPEMQNMMK
jgi:hypothetical protein